MSTHRKPLTDDERREAANASQRRYRDRNRAEVREKDAAWNRSPEGRASRYAWKAANREKVRASDRASRARHKERARLMAERAATVEQTIRAAMPASLPAAIREDVYQSLAVVFLLNGQLTPADVKAAIAEYYRINGVQSGRELSLNVPGYRDGSREEWIDRLESR